MRLGFGFIALLMGALATSAARAEEPPRAAGTAAPTASFPPTAPAPAATNSAAAPEPAPPVTETRNEDTVAACVKAAETAQTERSAHRLGSSRVQLLACAQVGCPLVVRSDCATWLAEVDQLMPSVVIQARDTRGSELVDVRVLVDGELVTTRLDGLAMSVDPGTHIFQFEAEGAPPLRQEILIREGEKGRSLPIVLAAPPPPQAAPKHVRRAPPATYIFGALGIAGMAGYTYFGITGLVHANDLKHECGNTKTCTDSQVAPVRRELVAADISLGVGLVSIGAALYFYFTSQPPSPQAVKPALVLGPGVARVGFEAPF